MRSLRVGVLALIALLPSAPKRWLLTTFFGYRIGRGTRIGLSLLAAGSCEIGEGVVIGHGNVFVETRRLTIGDGARIGHLNVFRGGDEIALGAGCEVLRLNVVNSIVNPVVTNPTDPRFSLGDGATLTEGHKIDFTDRVHIGDAAVIAGRRSSLWTHTRRQTAPVTIGNSCYIGSESRFAPGASIPDRCVVGMGAVVVDSFDMPEHLIAGVPARCIKPLDGTVSP